MQRVQSAQAVNLHLVLRPVQTAAGCTLGLAVFLPELKGKNGIPILVSDRCGNRLFKIRLSQYLPYCINLGKKKAKLYSIDTLKF